MDVMQGEEEREEMTPRALSAADGPGEEEQDLSLGPESEVSIRRPSGDAKKGVGCPSLGGLEQGLTATCKHFRDCQGEEE